MNDRESVSIPMNRPNSPLFDKRVQLPLDPFLLIQKPPAAPELNLARRRAVLKAADRRRERKIVDRIVVVDDRAR